MRPASLVALACALVLAGCATTIDVNSMLRDFDYYNEDLRAVATDQNAIATLDGGLTKRSDAGLLVEAGREEEALPVAEQALADARLALEMERMYDSSQRAERCRLEVQQARTAWSEAIFILEQTEEFVGDEAIISMRELDAEPTLPALPQTTMNPKGFPPASMKQVSEQWELWRGAARNQEVAAADLVNIYRLHLAASQAEKVGELARQHHRYVAARAVQSLECRLRAETQDRYCAEATRLTGTFGAARAEALRATLDLERGLQEELRNELSTLRSDAKSRQDELYDALSQMEGRFARIQRDARGTIVSLADILFDFDKDTLRRDVEFNLVKIATILNQFGEMNVLIEGHTDAIGTEEYNLGLSQRRAEAVYEFLVSQDVVAGRLDAEGYGESRPVAENETDDGRQRNRRVDLVIQDAR